MVVSGLSSSPAARAADTILTECSGEMYASGWVLDVSAVERDSKIKVEQCGGLGNVDTKIALYGIPPSGPLQLWFQIVVDKSNQHNHNDDRDARRYVSELVNQ
jgi:hypothetical protein